MMVVEDVMGKETSMAQAELEASVLGRSCNQRSLASTNLLSTWQARHALPAQQLNFPIAPYLHAHPQRIVLDDKSET